MRKAFDHIGIPTRVPQAGESWVPFSRVWVTNPRAHPQRLEYIRAEVPPQVDPAEVGLWKLWNWPHVAYRVESMQEALAGETLLLGPFDPGGFGQVAFVLNDGVVIEYIKYTDLDYWFGQPNPPDFVHVPFS
jgi:hypothetical protein